ncbi:MAG: hypothetical protein ACUVWR_12975 [Anaerolineae bacterium]
MVAGPYHEGSVAAERNVNIGRVVASAIIFDPKRPWDATGSEEDLAHTVTRLFAMLHERHIPYVLVGGLAMLQYVEGRNTEDVDLILAVPSLSRLPELRITSRELYFASGAFDRLPVHVLLTRNPIFRKVQRHYATTRHFAESAVCCATVEGLLLLKLYALPSLYRQGNFARVSLYENDLATLIHDYRPDLEPLLAELSRALSKTDLASLREILADIQRRLERFENKHSGPERQ